MAKLTKIMKDLGVSTNITVKLVQTIVFPALLYGCESWTLMKADKRKMDAFELWTWRRLLRIPWTARRTNASVINQIKPRHSLETLAVIGKLKYFGHIAHVRFNGKRFDVRIDTAVDEEEDSGQNGQTKYEEP
jgi:hypothetical protein